MRLFITGGTGFIGSHFVNAVLRAGHEAIVLRRSKEVLPRTQLTGEPEWLTKNLVEVSSEDLEGCDALIHFAAAGVLPGNVEWLQMFRTNVSDSLGLWLKAADAGVSRFLICGSCFEYGKAGERYEFIPVDAPLEPTGPYHASKAAASLAAFALARQKGLQLAILRPFHVFGEGESAGRFWPSLREAALAGRNFPMTLGEQVRDFVPVESVASTFLAAVTRKDLLPGEPKIENIGSGHPLSLRAFAEAWWKKWDAKGRLIFGEVPYREDEVMRYVPEISSSLSD